MTIPATLPGPPARNGRPEFRPYVRKARRPAWMLAALKAAETRYGPPGPTCTCGKPIALTCGYGTCGACGKRTGATPGVNERGRRPTTNVPGWGNDRGTGTAERLRAAGTTGRTRIPQQPSQPWPPAGHSSTRPRAGQAASGAPGAVQGGPERGTRCGYLAAKCVAAGGCA